MSQDDGGVGRPDPPAEPQDAAPPPPPQLDKTPQDIPPQPSPPPAYADAPPTAVTPPPGYPNYTPPPPGNPPPGYPQAAQPYPGYPPTGPQYPGYPPTGPQYPGYPPGQQYPGYPPGPQHPGYPPGQQYPGYPPQVLKPGVIPLRELTLSDIFNGAINYIRGNLKATLGLTAIVVVVAQLIGLGLQVLPLAALGELDALSAEGSTTDAGTLATVWTSLAGYAPTGLSLVVLSGMLTVVVARSVFGATISVGEAWQRVKGRLLPLLGMSLLLLLAQVAAFVVLFVIVFAGVAAVGFAGLLLFIPVGLLVGAGMVYLWVNLLFAPQLIVLERLSIGAAIKRSFALVKNSFWRVLGISLLAALVANMIAAALSVPFGLLGALLTFDGSTWAILLSLVLTAVGSAVGLIVTTPFSAGVVVLLYTDRRIRSEAFDLQLRSSALSGSAGPGIDDLWLRRT